MCKISNHYKKDRQYRDYIIRKKIGYGSPIAETVQYTTQTTTQRKQILVLSNTAIITVYNHDKTVLVTRIIAKPNYIKNRFPNIPHGILQCARENQTKLKNRNNY